MTLALATLPPHTHALNAEYKRVMMETGLLHNSTIHLMNLLFVYGHKISGEIKSNDVLALAFGKAEKNT